VKASAEKKAGKNRVRSCLFTSIGGGGKPTGYFVSERRLSHGRKRHGKGKTGGAAGVDSTENFYTGMGEERNELWIGEIGLGRQK